jgi:hypothetical protein
MTLLLRGEQGKEHGPSPSSTTHLALADLSSPPAETRADAPLPVGGDHPPDVLGDEHDTDHADMQ